MEPPVHHFTNTPTPTPKQCKHVKTTAQDAGQVSKKFVTYSKIQSRAVLKWHLCTS